MEWKEELAKKSVQDLRKIAGKLAIPGRSKLTTRAALLEAIEACGEKEIRAVLEIPATQLQKDQEISVEETDWAPAQPEQEARKSKTWDWKKKVGL